MSSSSAPPPEPDEARDRERDGAIDLEALRHVADDEARLAQRGALVGRLQAEQHPHQRGLAGAVGADQRQDLAGRDVDIDALQDGAAGAGEPQRAGADQRVGVVRERRTGAGICVVMVMMAIEVAMLRGGPVA